LEDPVWYWRIISDFPLKLVAYDPDRLVQAFGARRKQAHP
jgi:hypothetical protein